MAVLWELPIRPEPRAPVRIEEVAIVRRAPCDRLPDAWINVTKPLEVRLRLDDQLDLERKRVVFFPLSWTIVHPIDEKSPMFGMTAQELAERDAEFLVLLSGIDETFSQLVHARTSYKPAEIVFENTDLMPHNFVLVQPGSLEEVGALAEAQATERGALERQYVPKRRGGCTSTRIRYSLSC